MVDFIIEPVRVIILMMIKWINGYFISQILTGQYDKNFTAPLKLENLVDLKSGEFIIKF